MAQTKPESWAHMEQKEILAVLNSRYPMRFDRLDFVRDSGSVAYSVFSDNRRYFLRAVKPAFFDTAVKSVDVHVFLQEQGYSVPPIVFTGDGEPYVPVSGEGGEYLFVLYPFLEGSEADPEKDAEAIGELVGRLHRTMRDYPGKLIERDKRYYIGRYVDILYTKRYPKADEFASLGDALWEKVRDLPRGYCHGDMYSGNILKAPGGKLYVLDLDTSGEGFPMYDPVLICNRTNYFRFYKNGYGKSKKVLGRFLTEYSKYSALNQAEVDAFCAFIAVYHYQVQATVMEIFGYDCVDCAFFDKQLDWLHRWLEQCDVSIASVRRETL